MPANTHPNVTALKTGFPEEATAAGGRPFYLGLIAHLPIDQSPVVLRLNEDEHDELLLQPGSTRLLGRNANRPIRSWQARSVGDDDATLSIEFVEESQPDALVWHATGPTGPQGEPGQSAGALFHVRAAVGAAGLLVPAGSTADLVADTVSFTAGAGYDNATGIFTASAAGVFHAHAMACASVDTVALEMHTSSNGGSSWDIVASCGFTTHSMLTDYLSLAAGSMAKFVMRNNGGVDATCEGIVGSTARSYLLISQIA